MESWGLTTVVFQDITTHLAEAHQDEVHYPCPDCNQVFSTFTNLRHHCLAVHIGILQETHTCELCSKIFSSTSALKVHRQTFHNEIQIFQCPECEETFNKKTNMLNHLRRTHKALEAKRLQCDLCEKRFLCPSELRKHVERVHLKVRPGEVPCPVCQKSFGDSRDMKVHLNAVHQKDTQFPCPECAMVFNRVNDMLIHRRRIHGGEEMRQHVCPTCSKGFCSSSELKKHDEVVHRGERKHVCPECGKAFKVASHLTYHRRRHTGETPFQCPYCDKAFHGPGNIAGHVKKVHKTVYVGVAQRRRLNLPESAPPPPPGILEGHTKDQKVSRPRGKAPKSIKDGCSQSASAFDEPMMLAHQNPSQNTHSAASTSAVYPFLPYISSTGYHEQIPSAQVHPLAETSASFHVTHVTPSAPSIIRNHRVVKHITSHQQNLCQLLKQETGDLQ